MLYFAWVSSRLNTLTVLQVPQAAFPLQLPAGYLINTSEATSFLEKIWADNKECRECSVPPLHSTPFRSLKNKVCV